MSNISSSDYITFVKSKIGTPYVYGSKGHYGVFTQARLNSLAKAYPSMFTVSYLNKVASKGCVGKVCTDCSGLVCWAFPNTIEYGSSTLYSKAYARLPMSKLSDFAPGTVLYKSGHVGIYVGKDSNNKPICVEAKGIDYGTISGVITNPSRWTCGLTFSNIDYNITNPIPSSQISYKTSNPYGMPSAILKNGQSGNGVLWLQWELVQAGFGYTYTYNGKACKAVIIDGEFGQNTLNAVKAFQASCKIDVDGEVGTQTKSYLTSNTASIFVKANPYNIPTTILKVGSRGQDVMWVQYYLKNNCKYNLSIDGSFGAITAKCVKSYQSAHKISVDGEVGSQTLGLMVSGQ